MKKIHIFITLTTLFSLSVFANPVDVKTAQKAATTFLNNNGAKATQLTDLSEAAGFPNLYIFTTENSFVVMSADDCVQPILGYSFTGSFVAEGMPENVRGWLQGYNDEIQHAINHKLKATIKTIHSWKQLVEGKTDVAKSEIIVGELLTTKWNQHAPFNDYCPTGTVTGCVATAMSQIMNFHKWPTVGIGIHSYTHSSYGVQYADFYQTTYDWTHMKDNYTGEYTTTEAEAVATLVYHAGVSVNMNYGPSSGAFSIDIPTALINYFNYSNTAVYKNRYSNDSTDYWIAEMKAELDARRPMEYDGSGSSGGHSFVCDGYRSDDFFHFNWGWGNNSDGYFTINNLNPGSTYNNNQGAVFGIKPAQCSINAPTGFTAVLLDGTKDVNLSWDAVEGALSYKLFRDGNLIQTIEANQELSYMDVQIPYGTSIYYLRSVDSEGEMSTPSEYKTISLQFPAPTNLQAELLSNGHVSLIWDEMQGVDSYNIYCNEVKISTVSAAAFEDEMPIPTNPSYHVKAVDSYGDESPASTAVSVSVGYRTPVVNDLNVIYSDGIPSLSWSEPEWCYPQNESAQLSYGQGKPYYYWNVKHYAHRYPSSDLLSHIGKAIYKVSTRIDNVGTYTLYLFTNTIDDHPDPTSLADTRVLTCTSGGWRDIPLSKPVYIEAGKDLWIVIKQENTEQHYAIPSFDLSTYNANACYAGNSPTNLSSAPEDYHISWFIKAYLTDGFYTYNLYQDGTMVAGDLNCTTYEATLTENAANLFTVKTKYYGGETEASNKIGYAKGNTSLASLELATNDKMTVTEGSKLIVSESLTNAVPANLILENGAQLIHSSEDVKATVKKTITAYTTNDNGWNFIASPVTDNLTPSIDNGLIASQYDLYYYDEPEHYWRNYGSHSDNFIIRHTKGYLYANGAATTLQFEGTLTPSNDAVSLTGLSHSAETLNGFNLVGNPFACNTTLDQDCYVISGSQVILANTAPILAPCEGVFVKADSDTYTVTFTKANSAKASDNGKNLDLVVTQGKAILDRARVRFGDGTNMEKFNLDDYKGTQLTLWQDGQELAVAYAKGENEMPLNFKASKNGTYTLTIAAENSDLGYLHLIDNMTGNDIDLLITPSYTFEAKTSDYASRFRLVFTNNDAIDDDETFAYIHHGEIVINNVEMCQGTSIEVVDMTGRVIVSRDTTNRISTSEMAAGVYVLRLINGNSIKTQKIVIE